MYHSFVFVSFCFATSFIHSGQCRMIKSSLEDCPDDSIATHLAYEATKSASANIFGVSILDIRLPEDQLLSEPITCILVIDQVHDGTGGTISITNGGIGYEYVDLHITSRIWRGLYYKIQLFTAESDTSSSSTSASVTSSSSTPASDGTTSGNTFPPIPTRPATNT